MVSMICGKCGNQKVASGKKIICTLCNRRRSLAWQKHFPEKTNAKQRIWKKLIIRDGWTRAQAIKLRQRYKMTIDDYEARSIEQNGLCAICLQVAIPLVVDHNHDTNCTRSLLCKRCNFGLGCFAESTERLRAAANYLERWGA